VNALELAGLGAGYDGVEIVRDVTLHVGVGEVVALLGVNGAGKTTTVRAISGLIPARNGTVQLLGGDVTFARAHERARRGLGVVTDEQMLCKTMSVGDNLRLATRRADRRHEVLSWLPELDPLRPQLTSTLSGGEQRLVALARALVAGPKLLVVDELSAGLAPALATSVLAVLRRAATEWGTGVLIVEQATRLALQAADRAVVLARGRVTIEGAARDLARRPEVLATAYLGQGLD
jgi:branched-chain amino acid transport system ATP-binding protein